MAFIPLTGGGSLVDNIIDRFQDEPGFDFIAYTDAQQVTGELFRELIGPDFEPYKSLATYADIQANASAIALANANQNVQKIIEGIQETLSGFVLEAPGFEEVVFEDAIAFSLTPTVSTPETSDVQYRINGGNWVTIGSGTTVQTYSEGLVNLPSNTTYTFEFRHTSFGTQSIIGSQQVTTLSTAPDYNQIANDTTKVSVLFVSEVFRKYIWDSESFSNALMDSNNASRQWMIDNVSHTQTFQHSSGEFTQYDGKAFVLTLSVSNWGNYDYGYGRIQPGNSTVIKRPNETTQENKRVQPLTTFKQGNTTTDTAPRLTFVIMDRTDLDGQDL